MAKKFRREHSLGNYIRPDFYCIRARLVVEVDGESHQSDEAKRYDAGRDQWMKEQGIRTLGLLALKLKTRRKTYWRKSTIRCWKTPLPQPLSPQIRSKLD